MSMSDWALLGVGLVGVYGLLVGISKLTAYWDRKFGEPTDNDRMGM